ncbi:type II secretion system minor pseudopilin GspK [Thiomicrospira microaerophila]|uniref:type II secretion system minor pseudopilin GspK n=1 Tax=Thiomicrospira microaerophila TaxID=406020 RepID=UPI00200D0A4A|nr:type II secretion system minor pseudopilin GspK [Thiomicrospira microaerophila]UQB41710.1 type II secretion system minor pseudopilin GspK [Thiomicrospira microaerophila]
MKPLKQKGFALLTVLIVVALVAVIASGIQYQQRLDIQRSAYMLNQSQAIAVAAGVDAWVKKGLAFDAGQNQIDHLGEVWAQPMFPMAFEGGDISGQLFDMQARFNLNNLIETDPEKQAHWRAILERSLQQQNLPIDWVAPLIDWLDEDNNPIAGGAESDRYLLNTPPYRAANRMMVLPEEVRLLQGMDMEQFALISAWITTLPKITTINVNTAEAEVLLGLAEFMDQTLIDIWIELRQQEPAQDIAGFRQFIAQNTGQEPEVIQQALPDWVISVRTEFFQLNGIIEYGVARLDARALYYRQQQQVNLLQRWIALADE